MSSWGNAQFGPGEWLGQHLRATRAPVRHPLRLLGGYIINYYLYTRYFSTFYLHVYTRLYYLLVVSYCHNTNDELELPGILVVRLPYILPVLRREYFLLRLLQGFQ